VRLTLLKSLALIIMTMKDSLKHLTQGLLAAFQLLLRNSLHLRSGLSKLLLLSVMKYQFARSFNFPWFLRAGPLLMANQYRRLQTKILKRKSLRIQMVSYYLARQC